MTNVAAATTVDELLGSFNTPGGNVVAIRIDNGRPAGYLTQVTDGAGADGFRPGDLVLRNFTIGGDKVTFEVAIRRSKDSDGAVAPVDFVKWEGHVEDGALNGQIKDGEYVPQRGGGYKYVEATTSSPAPYTRATVTCDASAGSSSPFHLRAVGPNAATVSARWADPLPKTQPKLKAAVETSQGPVPHAEVTWSVAAKGPASLSATYVTETGSDGVAELELTLLPDGSYAPANQLRARPGVTLPIGQYQVTASADGVGAPEHASYTLTLERGDAWIIFLDGEEGAVAIDEVALPVAVDPSARFRIQVVDARASTTPVKLTLRSLDPDGTEVSTTSVDLARQGSSALGGPFLIYPKGPLPRGLDAFRGRVLPISTAPASQVIADIGGGVRARLDVYRSSSDAAIIFLRRALASYRQAIVDYRENAKSLTADQAARLALKERQLARATAILEDTEHGTVRNDPLRFSDHMKIEIVRRYILHVLLGEKVPDPNPPRLRNRAFPMNLRSAEPTRLMPYETSAELRALNEGFHRAADLTDEGIQAAANELMTKLRLALPGLAVGVANMLVGPVYSAYVLVFGQTLDGEDAEAVDRVLAGVDVALFVFGTIPRVDLARRVAARHAELGFYERFASRYNLARGERGIARLAERLEAQADRILAKLNLREAPSLLRAEIERVLERIPDLRTAQRLAQQLDDAGGQIAGGSRRGIGLLAHWLKENESIAFWETRVREGTAVSAGPGRYREAIVTPGAATRLGAHEELIEWEYIDQATGRKKRIDTGMINHDRKTVCIEDLTGQFRDEHYAKTQGYGAAIGAMPEFQGYTVRVLELYWDEKAGDFVRRLLGDAPAVPR